MMTAAAKQSTTPSVKGEQKSTTTGRRARDEFVVRALNMTWQLAIVVLVPVIGGAELDKALKTKLLYTLIGLGVAIVGSVAVMWRTLQAANRLPVPKLTAAQKRAIQKQYDEDDD